jgi:hypothetical protein
VKTLQEFGSNGTIVSIQQTLKGFGIVSKLIPRLYEPGYVNQGSERSLSLLIEVHNMDMTDAEINLAIAKIEYPDNYVTKGQENCAELSGPKLFDQLDYCNNWSDIGPIIDRENMFIAPIYDGWQASSIECDLPVTAETPTKAAALCYLKMKGVEL